MSYTDFLYNRTPDWVGSVWKKYSYRIYKLCLQKCATKDEADDLFQEVALRFCKKAGTLNNEVYLLPWFQTVLLNCHYDDYRKKNLGREIPYSSLKESNARYIAIDREAFLPCDDRLDMESVTDELSILFEALNPLEKMIVELSVVGGVSIRELSRLLGLSRASIVRRREQALRKMQEKMIMQKDRIKMIVGRDVSLQEFMECVG